MWILLLFATLMAAFGGWMLLWPLRFAAAVQRFSEQSWFHRFEVASRMALALLFSGLAYWQPEQWLFALRALILWLGTLFLILVGPAKHRQMASRIAAWGPAFRWLGLVVLLVAAALISYAVNDMF